MAWTAPRTWVAGETVTAAIGNTHWRDNLVMAAGATKPAASVSRAAAQSIPNNTSTAISFDTEVYDTDTMFAGSSTNVTIKTAGLWVITAGCGLNAAASSRRLLQILVNGTAVKSDEGAATAAAIRMGVSHQMRLVVNDVITLAVYQNSGGAVNTLTAAGDVGQLQATWLGA